MEMSSGELRVILMKLAFYNFTSTVRGHNRYEPLYSGVTGKSKNDRTILREKLSGDSFNRAHPRAVAEERWGWCGAWFQVELSDNCKVKTAGEKDLRLG